MCGNGDMHANRNLSSGQKIDLNPPGKTHRDPNPLLDGH